MKVILNKCFGGFGISPKAYKLYAEKKGIELYPYIEDYSNYTLKKETIYNKVDWTYMGLSRDFNVHYFTKNLGETVVKNFDNKMEFNELYKKYNLYINADYRTDPILIEVVEELGAEADGRFADLCVVEIPDNLNYVIDNYDGRETLHENVRTW